jgi:ribosomal protein S15P/S13E
MVVIIEEMIIQTKIVDNTTDTQEKIINDKICSLQRQLAILSQKITSLTQHKTDINER